MTAIFAFANPTTMTGFLGADDLEANTKARVDKVRWVFGRYAVACHGISTGADALDCVSYFEGKHLNGAPFPVPTSPQDLIDMIGAALDTFVPIADENVTKALGDGSLDLCSYRRIVEGKVGLVILDTQDCTLCHASFGEVFPPRKTYRTQVAFAMPGQLLCYLDDPVSIGNLTRTIEQDPWSWYNPMIARTAQIHPNKVGRPGAAFHYRDGRKEQFRSAFRSPDDYMQEVQKRERKSSTRPEPDSH